MGKALSRGKAGKALLFLCQGPAVALPKLCQSFAKALPKLCQGFAKALPRLCQGFAKGPLLLCQSFDPLCQGFEQTLATPFEFSESLAKPWQSCGKALILFGKGLAKLWQSLDPPGKAVSKLYQREPKPPKFFRCPTDSKKKLKPQTPSTIITPRLSNQSLTLKASNEHQHRFHPPHDCQPRVRAEQPEGSAQL